MAKAGRAKLENSNPLQPRKAALPKKDAPDVHVYNKKVVCITDSRGFETHRNLSPLEIRVDATDGFIPLWAEDVTLRYRFRERSIQRHFEDPDAAKSAILRLFGEALDAWGDAAPVRFKYDEEASDFEFVMMQSTDCDSNGCVLASAFFPDAGRHEFAMYPTMFEQTHKEQVDTFAHEVGHIFGLRHFFANISETRWPSRLFGEDNAFSIMNYGHMSEMTDADRSDLKKLYRAAWNGELTEIDGAPIRLVRPFSSLTDSVRPAALAARSLESTISKPGVAPIQILVGGRKISIE
jgi:hypothetical protein